MNFVYTIGMQIAINTVFRTVTNMVFPVTNELEALKKLEQKRIPFHENLKLLYAHWTLQQNTLTEKRALLAPLKAQIQERHNASAQDRRIVKLIKWLFRIGRAEQVTLEGRVTTLEKEITTLEQSIQKMGQEIIKLRGEASTLFDKPMQDLVNRKQSQQLKQHVCLIGLHIGFYMYSPQLLSVTSETFSKASRALSAWWNGHLSLPLQSTDLYAHLTEDPARLARSLLSKAPEIETILEGCNQGVKSCDQLIPLCQTHLQEGVTRGLLSPSAFNATKEECLKGNEVCKGVWAQARDWCLVNRGLSSLVAFSSLQEAKSSCELLQEQIHPDRCSIQDTLCTQAWDIIQKVCLRKIRFKALVQEAGK